MERTYRELTVQERSLLEQNGCLCADWDKVKVAPEGFDTSNLRGVRLMGSVRLGANSRQPAGIYNARIADCTIGEGVLISNIGVAIENYDIGDHVQIENTGSIVCDGRGNFGNGVEVSVLNEAGGREVTIFNGMSAQLAYITAMYRDREQLQAKLKSIALAECGKIDGGRGNIGRHTKISGCGRLLNVNVGEWALLQGASALENGSVNSTQSAPTFVGADIKAYGFITSPGSVVDNGSIVKRCFVGEACRINDGFTATDSLFFANSDCGAGEACSVFAGPFTVSHHKSSLLIAGYFSFFNAGSGANQSNHLFKTGAVHQGIHERGCKFGSNAYVMLPAREGAFSLVIGRHTSHHDTANLPYSYIVEEEGKSYLMPGFNLRSSGMARDIAKWPRRDKTGPGSHDRINYDEYNPYVGEKLLEGIAICDNLLARSDRETHAYNRVRIKNVVLKRGVALYRTALDALLGSLLALGKGDDPTGGWVDMAGMFAPKSEIEALLSAIEAGKINDTSAIEAELTRIHGSYGRYAYGWAVAALEKISGHEPSKEEIDGAVSRGAEATASLAAMRCDDAAHDDDGAMKTSYGIDGDSQELADADFEAVRKSQRK